MKILIIGEYSSLGRNLKLGFRELGIDTEQITFGDGWKKIDEVDKNDLIEEGYQSKNLKIKSKEIKGSWRIFELIRIYKYLTKSRNTIKKFLYKKKYDAVIILNQEFIANNLTHILFNSIFVELKEILKVVDIKSKIYMIACGDDSIYLNYLKNYRCNPYKNGYYRLKYKNFLDLYNYKKILKQIDGVIPTCFDYAEPYRNISKLCKVEKTIQFPIDLSKIEYEKNIVKEKIVIFHGLNREEFKGTKYIKKAMENIKKKYPDKVEIIIDGKMPLDKYKKMLEKTNIIIDQCNSYSYAMNALIGMAKGKVIFSGNEEECMVELGKNDIPVINITPSVEDIEKKLEYFIENPGLITEIGEKSRKFVEEFHDCTLVAKKYLEIMKDKSIN